MKTTSSTKKTKAGKSAAKKAETVYEKEAAAKSSAKTMPKARQDVPEAKPTEATAKPSTSAAEQAVSKPASPKKTYRNLFMWNMCLAALHGVQGIAIVLLSTGKGGSFPVTTNFLSLDKLQSDALGHPVLATATQHLFDVNLAQLIAAFFFMSSIAHLVIATVYRKKYEANLARGINKARWFEYALSASTMMVAIGMLTGMTDLSGLMMLFVLTAVMNLCGLAMEVYNQKAARPNWLAYIIGCVAGVAPWLAVSLFLFGSGIWGTTNAPTFVYWIYATLFLLFGTFAVNMLLQYKKVGKWKNYLYGERVYMILSLVAKTALAWQVFAGTLRP